MKIAFVSLYEAYPPVSGAASVTYNCAQFTPCDEALLVQFSDRASTERIGDLTIVSLRQQASSRLLKLGSMPRADLQIAREVARFDPDFVVLEGASWAVYMAVLAVILRRYVPRAKLVYHAHNVEYLLRKERESRFAAALTRRAEGFLVRTCARRFAVSSEDARQFVALYGIEPDLLPNGVDCRKAKATPEAIADVRKRFGIGDEAILFMGLYAYPPNAEAVRFLMEEVMPALHLQRPDAQLVITGGGPEIAPPWLVKTGLISRSDLDAVLSACKVGVAPIFKGSGTRLKILEYMAAGVPVVTTRKGAEGLDLESGRHTLYAETGAEFQEAILRVLSDKALSAHLSDEALQHVRSRFDWVPILNEFVTQLKDGRSS